MVPAARATSSTRISGPIRSTQVHEPPGDSLLGRNLGHVDHDRVHGHAAEDRRLAPADDDPAPVGERPQVAVGVARRDGGDAAWPRHLASGAVADGLAGRGLADLPDAPLQADRRAHGVGLGQIRVAAVERDARAQQVEVVIRAQEDAGRVGEGNARRRQGAERPLEVRELLRVQGMLRRVGAGQVTHEKGELDALQARRLGGQARHLVRRQAQAAHPGIDVQDGPHRPPLGPGAPGPELDLAQRVEGRHQAVLQKVVQGPGQQAAQNSHLGLRQHLLQRDPLAQLGDEEVAAAGGEEGPCHPRHAQAVGVGLDHRGTGHARPAPAGQDAVVGDDGVEVDGEDRAGPPGLAGDVAVGSCVHGPGFPATCHDRTLPSRPGRPRARNRRWRGAQWMNSSYQRADEALHRIAGKRDSAPAAKRGSLAGGGPRPALEGKEEEARPSWARRSQSRPWPIRTSAARLALAAASASSAT
jgi:hypothetical protein